MLAGRVLCLHLPAGVAVVSEVASFSVGRSSASHPHGQTRHPMPPQGSSRRGHPTAAVGLAETRPSREEEQRNLLTQPGHFQRMRNLLSEDCTILFPSGIRAVLGPFTK